jgi:hypothetical protein
MAKNDLCFACRTLIDEPWTEKPHGALKTFGTPNVRIVDFNTEYYQCRVCGADLDAHRGDALGASSLGAGRLKGLLAC